MKLEVRLPAITLLIFITLIACNTTGTIPDSDARPREEMPMYMPSTDSHPCLSVGLVAPKVVLLGNETIVTINISNRCDETTTFTSLATPYTLYVINRDNKIVLSVPEVHVSLPGEFSIPENDILSFDVPILLAPDNATPGVYELAANVSVAQDIDKAQYVEPLILDSKPYSINVSP